MEDGFVFDTRFIYARNRNKYRFSLDKLINSIIEDLKNAPPYTSPQKGQWVDDRSKFLLANYDDNFYDSLNEYNLPFEYDDVSFREYNLIVDPVVYFYLKQKNLSDLQISYVYTKSLEFQVDANDHFVTGDLLQPCDKNATRDMALKTAAHFIACRILAIDDTFYEMNGKLFDLEKYESEYVERLQYERIKKDVENYLATDIEQIKHRFMDKRMGYRQDCENLAYLLEKWLLKKEEIRQPLERIVGIIVSWENSVPTKKVELVREKGLLCMAAERACDEHDDAKRRLDLKIESDGGVFYADEYNFELLHDVEHTTLFPSL